MRRLFVFINLFVLINLSVQGQDSLDWDIDSVFDEPLHESPVEETPVDTDGLSVRNLIQRRGFHFDASYNFLAGIAPGWYNLPTNSDTREYYLDRYIKMRTTLGIDAQISDNFRTKTTIYFEIPGFDFVLGDFFFDYNIYDVVFLRGGKYNHSWGISPNYGFTNLLSRVARDDNPADDNPADSFIFKVDVPIGNGGFQALVLTRLDLMRSTALPKLEDFGYGGKYNLALRHVDLDLGMFYQDGMALRSFLSIKTTIGSTELYNEWVGAIDVNEPSNLSGAFNIGFGRDFFGGKFNVNGELFYNAEKDTYWYHPETNIREAGETPFIEGLNFALNLLYKPWEKGNPRFFLQARYAPMQNSALLVPGFRLSPWPHIDFYLATPLSLGNKDGYYHNNTVTRATENEDKPLPFAVIFLISLSGSVQFGHYY